jgi:hypothetical protein
MKKIPPPEETPINSRELAAQATAVLKDNDMSGWTRAAPNLYPHQ